MPYSSHHRILPKLHARCVGFQDRKGHLKRGLREREIPNFTYLTISPKGSAHRAVLPSGRYLRPARFKGPPVQVCAAAFGLGGHDPRSVKTVARQQESALLLARRQGILLHLFPAMAGFAPSLLSCSQAAWQRSLPSGRAELAVYYNPPFGLRPLFTRASLWKSLAAWQ
jgi:hypothetical protein